MTMSAPRPVREPQPRMRPAPSERDQQIYLEYQGTGKSQIELAGQYKLTQCRVSQIVRRVERWLRDSPSALQPGKPNAAAAGALERRLEHERLNFVCREAMRHFHQEQKTVTHKQGHRGDTAFDETTERQVPPNVQFLKAILQANAQLSRLADKPPVRSARPAARKGLNDAPGPIGKQSCPEEGWTEPRRAPAAAAGFPCEALVCLTRSSRGLQVARLALALGYRSCTTGLREVADGHEFSASPSLG